MFNIKVFPDFSATGKETSRENAIREELLRARRSLGADYVNASVLDYRRNSVEAIHFLTYPMRWISHYITHFRSGIDPLFQLDFRTVSMVDWRDIHSSDEELLLFSEFEDFDLGCNGLTVIQHLEREMYCALSASFSIADDKWPAKKREIGEIMKFAAERVCETYRRQYLSCQARDFNITRREIECLYWVAMGKTDEQISELLNIGKWTVNGHLQSAKYKLGSASRSAAVARAITAGIISLRRVG